MNFCVKFFSCILIVVIFAKDASAITRKIISTPNVPLPMGPYSQAVQVDSTLYISGQLGLNLGGELPEGIENQTRLALQNIGHILEAVEADFSHVVKTSVLLSNISDYQVMNSVYAEFFKTNFPARAAYQAGNLPGGGLVEIEAVAVVGDLTDDPETNKNSA